MTKLWFLDLDDTLFEASSGMLRAIHLRMNDFMARELNITLEEANALRTQYWAKYGATFIALWRIHHVDPVKFLTETHDFDPTPYIAYEGNISDDVRKLSGQKVIFTNGPRLYADKVVRASGLDRVCDDVVTSFDMKLFQDWRPKPDASILVNQCLRRGVRRNEATIVDDSLMNLKVAKSIGLQTVWCVGYRLKHDRITHRQAVNYVDHQITHIRELQRLPKAAAKQKEPLIPKPWQNRWFKEEPL